jgi:iron complex outermembrane receptor protein
MDNITVGYTFPWGAQQLRFYGVVQNAFTITGYSGVDPTAGVNGIDNNIYPRARTFTSGLSVQF